MYTVADFGEGSDLAIAPKRFQTIVLRKKNCDSVTEGHCTTPCRTVSVHNAGRLRSLGTRAPNHKIHAPNPITLMF